MRYEDINRVSGEQFVLISADAAMAVKNADFLDVYQRDQYEFFKQFFKVNDHKDQILLDVGSSDNFAPALAFNEQGRYSYL